jgi:hypothetical protein
MKKIFTSLGLFLFTAVALCQSAVTLGGTVKDASGNAFNGYLSIRMPRSGVKNTCVTPNIIVPTLTSTYQITNGVPQNIGGSNFVSQDCMLPRIPYYVELSDTNSLMVGSDNWYLPLEESGAVNIGDMQEAKFTGPITVAIPQAIISTPAANQVITQPAGTSLTINGTLNITGTVNYTTPPAFTLIKTNQILVNGVASSSFPEDVNGIINSSQGYCVASCLTASLGQALIYNGTAFVPGTVSVVYPSLYNQTLSVGGVAFPQRNTIAFDSNGFALTDSASPSQTSVALAHTGTAGTYANIATITTDIFGRVGNVTTSTAYAPGTISFTGFTAIYGSSYTYSVNYGSVIPSSAAISCSASAPLPVDIKPDCYASGVTAYVQLTNTAGSSAGNVFVPSNVINFRILP